MAAFHSQVLGNRNLALAGAFKMYNTEEIGATKLNLINVLLDENKIGVQCVEKIRYEGEEEGVKEAEVKKNDIQRTFVVSRGINAGGCCAM